MSCSLQELCVGDTFCGGFAPQTPLLPEEVAEAVAAEEDCREGEWSLVLFS